MFDTHEFVATLKSAGASEEQATLALRAVAKALETTREGLVTKDALTDLKLFIGNQFAEMKADTDVKLAALKSELKSEISDQSVEIRNLRFMTATTLSVVLVAVGKYLFT